jgi:hypothetical protein
LFDGFTEGIEIKWSIVTLTVDEERWSSVDATSGTSSEISPHSDAVSLVRNVSLQLRS